MSRHSLVRTYQLLIGACELATGLLLIAAPGWTLALMNVRTVPREPALVSFIGAFVFGVGLSYLAFAREPCTAVQLAGLKAQWLVTGVLRAAVGLYVLVAVLTGQLEDAWLSVAGTDLFLAIFQFWWWRAVKPGETE